MKIYVLGDSFTDNLYKREMIGFRNNEGRGSEVSKYINLIRNQNLPDALYFDDYLRLYGHEVINLGIGGCSNESIYHQFTQIKEPFDRLIINWTSICRFDWYGQNSKVKTFTGGVNPDVKLTTEDEFMIEQGFNRDENIILIKKTIDFISYFVKMYEKQKPIIWSPFENFAKLIQNQKGFIWDIKEPIFNTIIPDFDKLEIITETNGKIIDRHYSRYGNFYTALVFNTILEHTKDIEHDGYYIKDSHLIDKIKENIKNSKHNLDKLIIKTKIL